MKRIFDAWEVGGIKGFVFGRTLFADAEGQFTIPAFSFQPASLSQSRVGTKCPQHRNRFRQRENCSMRCSITPKRAVGRFFIFAPGSGANGCKNRFHSTKIPTARSAWQRSGMRHSAASHRSMAVLWMVGTESAYETGMASR